VVLARGPVSTTTSAGSTAPRRAAPPPTCAPVPLGDLHDVGKSGAGRDDSLREPRRR
jgi:hypothetical protein